MAAPNALQSTVKLYQNVIEEVVNNSREAFLDDGIDEAILVELKQIWETKVLATKVVDTLDPNNFPLSTSSGASTTSRSTPVTSSSASTSYQRNADHFTHLAPSTSHQQQHASGKQHFAGNTGLGASHGPRIGAHQNLSSTDYSGKHAALRSMQSRQFEYNPISSSSSRQVPLLQPVAATSNYSSAMISNAARAHSGLNPTPFEALVRQLPHSVITNAAQNNVYMQMAGVQASFHNILPPPLTSTLSGNNQLHNVHQQQQQQQHYLQQQFLASLPKPDKSAVNLSGSSLMSNVIVMPSQQYLHQTGHNLPGTSSSATNIVNSSTNRQNSGKNQVRSKVVVQLDGATSLGSDDDDDDDLVEEDDEEDINVEDDSTVAEEPATNLALDDADALNSEDDEVSNGNGEEMFEADDVIVCQFEKVSRIRNKWKFILKDGIIHLHSKDYVFNKAVGEAEF